MEQIAARPIKNARTIGTPVAIARSSGSGMTGFGGDATLRAETEMMSQCMTIQGELVGLD